MNYDISISVQEGSAADRNIQSVARQQHVTPSEAALKLLDSQPCTEGESPVAFISRVRAEKARRKSGIWPVAAPDGSAEKLIGLLADAPDTAEAIRSLASERRAQVYGQ